VAGEASGDLLGAGLIAAIERLAPGSKYFGIAGPRMADLGCEGWHHTEELSVMGLAEVLQHLPRLLWLRRGLIARLKSARPDVFIGIDSPDFNLPIAAVLKRHHVPTVQYVSPQVWAWRQSRVVGIRRAVDRILCLLPFEKAFYDAHGVDAVFVGHPLADEIPLSVDREAARAALGLAARGRMLAVLPGSRRGEVSRLARPFAETAQWLQRRDPDLTVVVALASDATRELYVQHAAGVELDPQARLVTGRAREVLAAADAVLTASGTASHEAMLIKRPMVVAYIISSFTHRILRLMGLDRLEYFALPNLLAGRELFPEYLQGRVRADVMGPPLESMLRAPSATADWYDSVLAIHRQLRRDANAAAAAAVIDLLVRKPR
jgi:lipid-A-disaccharide synthase